MSKSTGIEMVSASQLSLAESSNLATTFLGKKKKEMGIVGRTLPSLLTFLRTYSQTLPDGTKESWYETVERNMQMHIDKFPQLESRIRKVYEPVFKGRVVPSMRSLQYGGKAIRRANARMFNCTYCNIISFKDFADMTYLLMCGCGTGYSVQQRHIQQLPVIASGDSDLNFVIPDNKEGWADSMLALLTNPKVRMDYSQVSLEGTPLDSGGVASGPIPLRRAHVAIRAILSIASGRQLRPLEAHDIMCHIANAVVAGGIRESAMICLFDSWDMEMLTCKFGEYWADDLYEVPGFPGQFPDWKLAKMVNSDGELRLTQEQYDSRVLVSRGNPQRGRANNSAVVLRTDPQADEKIRFVVKMCFLGRSGEPGLYLTNSYDVGANPCVEIGLYSRQMCNLEELNASEIHTDADWEEAVTSAAAIGTMQASYTDFKYIHPDWKVNCDREALLGLSITGQACNWEFLTDVRLNQGAELAKKVNAEWSEDCGTQPAARIGCTKPAGSSSLTLGNTTSGIHAGHSKYGLRRIRLKRSSPVTPLLVDYYGVHQARSGEVLEESVYDPNTLVVTFPVLRENTILREDETAVDLLNRAKHVHDNWIVPSHRSGTNRHNVSITVNYKPEEEKEVLDWMVAHKSSYNGIALFPYDNGSYVQAPFEEVSEHEYHSWVRKIGNFTLDLNEIDFSKEVDERGKELACANGACDVK